MEASEQFGAMSPGLGRSGSSSRIRSRLHGPRVRATSSKLALEVLADADSPTSLPSPPLSAPSTSEPAPGEDAEPSAGSPLSMQSPHTRPTSSHSLPASSKSRPPSSHARPSSSHARPTPAIPFPGPSQERLEEEGPPAASALHPSHDTTERSIQAPSPTPSSVSRKATPTPKPIVLPAPPALDFTPPELPRAPPYRGLTFHTAHWTLTSADLQRLVSRAIRRSAREDAIRLLPLDSLDRESKAAIERVEGAQRAAQAQYRFLVQRRRMLLQGLCAVASSSDGGAEDGAVTGKLAVELAGVSGELDALAAQMLALAGELAALRAAREVHHASALAIALRKLNASYAKRTAQVQKAHKRVEDLEAELDEAWRVAEELAREVDGMGATQDMQNLADDLTADIGRARLVGIEQREEEHAEEADSPIDGRRTSIEDQTLAFGRANAPEPSEEELAARAALHRDPEPDPELELESEHKPDLELEPEHEYDSDLDSSGDEDSHDDGTTQFIAIVPVVRAVASKVTLLQSPTSPPPGAVFLPPPLPTAPRQPSTSDPSTPIHSSPTSTHASEADSIPPPVPPKPPASPAKPLTSGPPQEPLPSPPTASILLSGLISPDSAAAAAASTPTPTPQPPSRGPPLYIPPAPVSPAPIPGGLISPSSSALSPSSSALSSSNPDAPRLPSPIVLSPLTMSLPRRASADSLRSTASHRVSAAKKRASMKTKGGLRMPRLSGHSMTGPGPKTRSRSQSRARPERSEPAAGGVPFPPVPQVPVLEAAFLAMDPASDAASFDRSSFLDMRTPKVSMMTRTSTGADEDVASERGDFTVRIPLANGKGKAREVTTSEATPSPHMSTLSFMPSISLAPDEAFSDAEGVDHYAKHASTQGLAPRSVRRASVSEYSTYTYRKRESKRATGDPRERAKSPERLVAWLGLGTLRPKAKTQKRFSSPADKLVEEEPERAGASMEEGPSRSSSSRRVLGSSSQGSEEGHVKGVTGRMLEKFAQKARR